MTVTRHVDLRAPYAAAFEASRAARSWEPAFLRSRRQQAFDKFMALGFPSPRDEEWRFTDIAPITSAEFTPASPGRNGYTPDTVSSLLYEGCLPVVVVDGHVVSHPLASLPEGVVVADLASSLDSHPRLLEEHLARYAPFETHAFAALNTSFFPDAVVIIVPEGVVVPQPIQVLSFSTAGADALVAAPRVLVVAGRSSQVTVVERFAAAGSPQYLNLPATEIVAGDGAVVDHYKVQEESTQAFHLSTLHAELGRGSSVSSHSISTGGAIVRHDVGARLAGEGADCILNGLYMVNGDQHVDTHMRVEHVAPHCTSHELYKGILDERASAVFNGRIFVHREAQQTDAVQANRNLLLSREALVNSNPQLEIFADDVRCTHGSTTGQMDEDAVFYLRSRGIGDAAARSLLVYAFASDIVERIKVPAVRKGLEEFLFARLPRGDVVRQAV